MLVPQTDDQALSEMPRVAQFDLRLRNGTFLAGITERQQKSSLNLPRGSAIQNRRRSSMDKYISASALIVSIAFAKFRFEPRLFR